MPKRVTFGVLSIAILALSACNTTSTDASNPLTANATGYETLASDAEVTSTLGGVALKFKENPDVVTLSSSSGTLTHNTGTITIDDGTYELIDDDGFAANGLLSDGLSVLIATPAQGFSSSYEYARVYNQGYLDGTTPYSVVGVYGIVTSATDMPSSGSASYTGEAEGSYTDGTTNYDLDNGTSSVEANFATGFVDVTMEGFDVVERDTGTAADVGFNGVNITGMSTSGNQFTGGTITTRSDGTLVQIIGTQTQETAIGRFFGLDSSNNPDEVGGIGYLAGSDGSVSTIFLAD